MLFTSSGYQSLVTTILFQLSLVFFRAVPVYAVWCRAGDIFLYISLLQLFFKKYLLFTSAVILIAFNDDDNNYATVILDGEWLVSYGAESFDFFNKFGNLNAWLLLFLLYRKSKIENKSFVENNVLICN